MRVVKHLTTRIVAGAALAAGAIGAGYPAAAAPAPPTVPAGWTTLVDDLGRLAVAVPPGWDDVDTAPAQGSGGTPAPWISASPDFRQFQDTWDAPGLVYSVVPYTADPASILDGVVAGADCSQAQESTYDDGLFVGVMGDWTGCGGSSSLHVVAANIDGETDATYVLHVQLTGADGADVLDGIVRTFTVGTPESPTPEPPGSAAPVPGGATTPAGPTAPSGPSTPVADPSAETITDDTGTLQIAVPASWTARTTHPREPAGGAPLIPEITATTDSALFEPAPGTPDTYSVPGVVYLARPFTADTVGLLDELATGVDCRDQGTEPYDDGVFVGHIRLLTDCGGTATRVHLVAASPADRSLTVALWIQLTADTDDSVLTTLLNSFQYTP